VDAGPVPEKGAQGPRWTGCTWAVMDAGAVCGDMGGDGHSRAAMDMGGDGHSRAAMDMGGDGHSRAAMDGMHMGGDGSGVMGMQGWA
jgi:hypothetical protein